MNFHYQDNTGDHPCKLPVPDSKHKILSFTEIGTPNRHLADLSCCNSLGSYDNLFLSNLYYPFLKILLFQFQSIFRTSFIKNPKIISIIYIRIRKKIAVKYININKNNEKWEMKISYINEWI